MLFYTWPLKYIGMGEVAVILVWGPLMVGGGYYVITGARVNADVILASLPCALAATTVLFGKHTDKLDADAAKGIRTMPVLLGEKNARYATIAMVIAAVRAGALPDPQRLPVVADAGGVLRRRLGVEGDPGLRARAPGGTAARVPAEHLAAVVRGARASSTRDASAMLFLLGLILDVIARGVGLVG